MSGGESELIQSKLPCEDCGSSDALALYSDGHTHCFSCNTTKRGTGDGPWEPSQRPRMSEDLQALLDSCTIQAVTKRKLTQATCQALDYRVRVSPSGKQEHVAVYRDRSGVITGAKVRVVDDKEFYVVGELPPFWGMESLARGGRKVIIVGGEVDRATVSQLWGNKFPVLCPSKGEKGTAKAVAACLEDLARFDEVVIGLDMDEVGRDATIEAARILPPGKAKVASFTRKDPNEMLMAGETDLLQSQLMGAAPYRPDGIVAAKDLIAQALCPTVTGLSFPWEFMTNWTYGWRDGEVIVNGAGTGVGKTDLELEVAAHLISVPRVPVALFNYEAGPVQTLKGIAGKLAQRRFHIPDPEGVLWSQDELVAALHGIERDHAKLFINDHYGAVSWEAVKERTRYLAHAEGVKRVFVDPMAALVASEEDERKALDRMMAESKSLSEELQIGMWFNSHLARPAEGKSHEEGGRVTLRNFRGSGAIVMWASFVFGMERNQQAEDETERAKTYIRVLKDRFTGDSTGKTQAMVYNTITGRLETSEPGFNAQDEQEPELPK